MLTLSTALPRVRPVTRLSTGKASTASPSMKAARRTMPPLGWRTQQRATYYFDATWHTALTLRRVIRANLAREDLGISTPPELLAQTMEVLLSSICPGLPEDTESRAHFRKLLQAHLDGLTANELSHLSQLLKSQAFDCSVTESVIDDAMLETYGFTNGPPHRRQRKLMLTPDLHQVIDTARSASDANDKRHARTQRLSAADAAQTRALIAAQAQRYTVHGITLKEFTGVAASLADAIGLVCKPTDTIAATPLPPVSAVDWQQALLIIDLQTITTLIERRDHGVYASVLRDLLELLLARKRFGPGADLLRLDAGQRSLLFRDIEQVLSLPPCSTDPALQAAAARVLAAGTSFGTVQIAPTAGVALGHAWIAPILSVTPDKTRSRQEIGTRFMRSGFRLEPAPCTVSEWEIRWLNARENEDLYPAAKAWHLRVPAPGQQLQQAAAGIMQEWRSKSLPYRFIGTAPGMPATGCRVTVWQAVQRAMDEEARTLFSRFTLGLPEPESPTELALRLEQFMQWLFALAAQNGFASTDL